MTSTKPTLSLSTPKTANFPADACIPRSAWSAKSPQAMSPFREALHSAGLPSAGLPSGGLTPGGFYGPLSAIKTEDSKTPITPPSAYLDFLKYATLTSPNVASPGPVGAKAPLNRTSTAGSMASTGSSTTTASDDSSGDADGETTCVESGPSTASSMSDASECSCSCSHLVHKSSAAMGQPASMNPKTSNPLAGVPPSPFTNGAFQYPLSAPPTGPTSFPGLHVPPSPARSGAAGITSESPAMSPFSARSVRSPFDWEAALKARRYAEAGAGNSASKLGVMKHASGCKAGRPTVRHIREVVTRTVTYTPRMNPAPKGKRRKVE